ncbi:dihydroxyacetone kinase subunit DhaL [Mycoplasma sp. 6243]|uniref:dihydroxyacetone kinase subunit DhaL n=1 Tax=Mycoplasma sp. 6243 TaxID=3440865 RepID=UPI003EB820A4
MEVKYQNLVDAMHQINIDLQDNQDYLSSLDQAIGDGDHGFNMVRGFVKVAEIRPNNLDLSGYLNQVGRTLMSVVGGASGPLYGMAFLQSGNTLRGSEKFDLVEFKTLIETFAASLEKLGRASLNEKTMYDVWKPLASYLENKNNLQQKEKDNLIEFVKSLSDKTKEMQANKGRASYLKERSIGTVDPGSYSSYLILKNLIKVL